ncbi:MAG: transketolase [Clostridiales bacterium]|nr:transketolase [Clostridiales bacterium]
MVYEAESGHIGGSLSAMDILTLLYHEIMRVNPENPCDEQRDRFVLSKGHCTPALYSALASKGFFPEEDLKLFRSIKAHYSGHPDMRHVKGVDMSTGSLGQGISAAVGMALAGKLDKKDYKVYCLMGDGELQEGQVWEAFMAASKYKLDNLIVIVDLNGLQIDGKTEDVMPVSPVNKKLSAFGFEVREIDGHNFEEIRKAFISPKTGDGPLAVVAHTVKGKGVSFMENNAGWHGKAPNAEQYEAAMKELLVEEKRLEGRENE